GGLHVFPRELAFCIAHRVADQGSFAISHLVATLSLFGTLIPDRGLALTRCVWADQQPIPLYWNRFARGHLHRILLLDPPYRTTCQLNQGWTFIYFLTLCCGRSGLTIAVVNVKVTRISISRRLSEA